MSVILVVAGGLLGFATALTSLFAFDATLLQSLGIWTGTGFLACAAAVVLALTADQAAAGTAGRHAEAQPEIA